MRTVLAIIAVLGLAASVNAAIVVQVDPGVDVGDGLMSYTVRLVSDTEAGKATAWDVTFEGPMNQIWAYGGNLPTPTLTNVNAPGSGVDATKDSHFLFLDSSLAIARTPNETPTGPAGTLDGAAGIQPDFTLQDLPFAQIVLAAGNTVTMTGTAANAAGDKFNLWPYHNSQPVADADGPYIIDAGETLTLDASGSWDDDDNIYSYSWDLDGDWTYETDAGDQPVFSVDYAYLESLGLGVCDPSDPYDINLKVTDVYYSFGTDNSTLTILPEPVTLSFLVVGGLALIRRRRK